MAKKHTEAVVTQPVEKSEALADKLLTGEAFSQRNRNILLGVLAAVVLVVGGLVGFNYYKGIKDQEAQSVLFPAVYHFESDSLNKALKGDGANEGLVDVADQYGMTKAGNLAKFYAGTAYLKQGKFDEAIEYLKDFESSDFLVQARAYALLGDAYMEKNQLGEAVNYYEKAADYKPNEYFTPSYLMKLALAQELNKDNGAAIQTYEKVIKNYPASAEAINAKKYKSKLEGSAGQ